MFSYFLTDFQACDSFLIGFDSVSLEFFASVDSNFDLYSSKDLFAFSACYLNFKVKVTSTKSKKVLSGVKVKVRVYTGRKYKTYTIKTNKKGIASLKISQKRGKHKVVLSPGSPTYYYAKAITRTLTVTR